MDRVEKAGLTGGKGLKKVLHLMEEREEALCREAGEGVLSLDRARQNGGADVHEFLCRAVAEGVKSGQEEAARGMLIWFQQLALRVEREVYVRAGEKVDQWERETEHKLQRLEGWRR